jgi:hypothetical protein
MNVPGHVAAFELLPNRLAGGTRGTADLDSFSVPRLPDAFKEAFFITLIQEEAMSLRTVDDLAPDTLKSYRSKLRRLWMSLPALSPDQARIAAQKIAQLEEQLGIKAVDIPGPGRPRRFF